VSEPVTHEDRTILALLDALEGGGDPDVALASVAASGDEAGEAHDAMLRLHTEVLGLLSLGADPVAPPPGLRQRVLAAAAGDDTQDLGSAVMPASVLAGPAVPGSERPRRPRVVTPVRPVLAVPTSIDTGHRPEASHRPPAVRAARWPLALAATLAFLFLGLTVWLYSGVRQQGATIDQLRAELRSEQERAGQLAAEQAEMRTQFVKMQSDFGLVTSPAVEISPMKPAESSPQQQAKGILYVAGDHQHWYLSVHDLEPLGAGRRYNLWFVSDHGAVSGGSFDARPGSPVNLSSEHMPANTKAVVITLEPAEGAPAPSGPEVLRATGKVQIL